MQFQPLVAGGIGARVVHDLVEDHHAISLGRQRPGEEEEEKRGESANASL